MKRTRRPGPPVRMPSGFTGFRFPPEVILLAVRWYLRYGLSYRDLEELLAERGIEVDHVTLYRWVQRFTPLLIDAARPTRHLAGDRWFVDETYVKVAGVWSYVYRAVGQHGQVIDVYVSQRRDIASARRFFKAALTVPPSWRGPCPRRWYGTAVIRGQLEFGVLNSWSARVSDTQLTHRRRDQPARSTNSAYDSGPRRKSRRSAARVGVIPLRSGALAFSAVTNSSMPSRRSVRERR